MYTSQTHLPCGNTSSIPCWYLSLTLLTFGTGFWLKTFFFSRGGAGESGSFFINGSIGFPEAGLGFSTGGWGDWGVAPEAVWGVEGVLPETADVGGAFRRPRSDLTRLLSTISSSNFRRFTERWEVRLCVVIGEFLWTEKPKFVSQNQRLSFDLRQDSYTEAEKGFFWGFLVHAALKKKMQWG